MRFSGQKIDNAGVNFALTDMFSFGLVAALPVLCVFRYFGVLSEPVFRSAFAAYSAAIFCLVVFSNAALSMFFAGLLYFAMMIFGTLRQKSMKKTDKAIALNDFENGKGKIMLDGCVFTAVSSGKEDIKCGEILLASAAYGGVFAVIRKIKQ